MSRFLINTNHVTGVEISFINSTITDNNEYTRIHLNSKFNKVITIEGNYSKHADVIELTVLNFLESKKFVSYIKLEEAVMERIKSAEKAEEDYQNRTKE